MASRESWAYWVPGPGLVLEHIVGAHKGPWLSYIRIITHAIHVLSTGPAISLAFILFNLSEPQFLHVCLGIMALASWLPEQCMTLSSACDKYWTHSWSLAVPGLHLPSSKQGFKHLLGPSRARLTCSRLDSNQMTPHLVLKLCPELPSA